MLENFFITNEFYRNFYPSLFLYFRLTVIFCAQPIFLLKSALHKAIVAVEEQEWSLDSVHSVPFMSPGTRKGRLETLEALTCTFSFFLLLSPVVCSLYYRFLLTAAAKTNLIVLGRLGHQREHHQKRVEERVSAVEESVSFF